MSAGSELDAVDSLQPWKNNTDQLSIPSARVIVEDGGEAEDPHGQRETQQEHHAERKRGQDAGERRQHDASTDR